MPKQVLTRRSLLKQARSGHDVVTIPSWYVSGQAERLEPMDDLVAQLTRQNGKIDWTAEYLGRFDGPPCRSRPAARRCPPAPASICCAITPVSTSQRCTRPARRRTRS